MPKKSGLTLERHETLGLELQTMRDKLVNIVVELSRAYPAKVSGIASKACDTIDSLRSALDDKVCAENKDFTDATKVYYRANRSDYPSSEEN